MKNIKLLITALFLLILSESLYAQCSYALNAGTPTSTPACYDFDALPCYSSSSNCVGGGFGGSGCARIIKFCTNAANDCVVFNLTGLAGTNGTNYAVYTGCSSNYTLSGFTGEGGCYSNSANSVISTSNMNLSANTCYYMRVWTKDPPTTSSQICLYTQNPTNDDCTGAMGVDATVQPTDNYCMTPGTSDPSPAQFCAGSLENNAWYTFTVANCGSPTCTVTVTFSNINCNGGAAGFQIGFWTGTCGSLSYMGCTSGSGGTVTASITAAPGTVITMGLDGNAGAFCEFGISATNVLPLPVGLFDLTHTCNDAGVELDWRTVTEQDNAYFTVERSIDGINFEELTKIDGAGNSQSMLDYTYLDRQPNLGINYYRLSQTDYNGETTELKTIAVETYQMFEELSLAPNPVNEMSTLSFISKEQTTTIIEIIDISGHTVSGTVVETDKGENKFEVDCTNLNKGIYFLRLSNTNEVREIRFIK